MHAGFQPEKTLRSRFQELLGNKDTSAVAANADDAAYLLEHLEVYYEFPPVFQPATTRWGDPWEQDKYPTPSALLSSVQNDHEVVYRDEATDYTWLCYVRLR